MFLRNDSASTGIVALMCADPHFLTIANYLLYIDAPTNQPVFVLHRSSLISDLLLIV